MENYKGKIFEIPSRVMTQYLELSDKLCGIEDIVIGSYWNQFLESLNDETKSLNSLEEIIGREMSQMIDRRKPRGKMKGPHQHGLMGFDIIKTYEELLEYIDHDDIQLCIECGHLVSKLSKAEEIIQEIINHGDPIEFMMSKNGEERIEIISDMNKYRQEIKEIDNKDNKEFTESQINIVNLFKSICLYIDAEELVMHNFKFMI